MTIRPLSVIYVENDPALRGLITGVLKSKPAIGAVFDFGTGEEAISFSENLSADLALIDISLGAQVMDGVAVGTQLRLLNSDIGIVLFTQHSLESITALIDLKNREGWSFFQKRADSDLDELVEVLRVTATGRRVIAGASGPESVSNSESTTARLTSRQHLVLSMLATGLEPKAIAEKLNMSFDSVRRDLSNAYAILVPTPEPGTDLRVTSILRYQQLTNSPIQHG
jgi:DNA-binding NarL/FixJ family response regulator